MPSTVVSASADKTAAVLCKSCGTAVTGAYCSVCGQAADTQRFTMRSFFSRAVLDALDLHRGLLFTFLELCRRPGEMIRGYVLGDRVRHYNPVKYFLLAFTLSVTLDELAGSRATGLHSLLETTPLGKLVEIPLLLGLAILYAWMYILSIRLVRGDIYNPAEKLTFLLYTLGHFLLFSTVLMLPLQLLWPASADTAYWLLFPTYFLFQVWASRGFYSKDMQRAAEVILTAHLRMVLLLFIVMMAGSILVSLYVFFWKELPKMWA